MSVPLYLGMGPPYFIRFPIASSADFDPELAATATAIVLLVTKPSTAEVEWTATVESHSATQITLRHNLAVEDLDERGSYSVSAHFTLPAAGGVLRTLVGRTPNILSKNQPSV